MFELHMNTIPSVPDRTSYLRSSHGVLVRTANRGCQWCQYHVQKTGITIFVNFQLGISDINSTDIIDSTNWTRWVSRSKRFRLLDFFRQVDISKSKISFLQISGVEMKSAADKSSSKIFFRVLDQKLSMEHYKIYFVKWRFFHMILI